MSWIDDNDDYDSDDIDDIDEKDSEQYDNKPVDTNKLIQQASDILERLRTYTWHRGFNMFIYDNCFPDLIDLLEFIKTK